MITLVTLSSMAMTQPGDRQNQLSARDIVMGWSPVKREKCWGRKPTTSSVPASHSREVYLQEDTCMCGQQPPEDSIP